MPSRKISLIVPAQILLAALCCSAPALPQSSVTPVRDPIFSGAEVFAQRASSITEVYTGPVTLETLKQRLAANSRRRSLSSVYSFRFEEPGMYDIAAVDRYRQALLARQWHCVAETERLRPDEHRDVCTQPLEGGYVEKATIDTSPRQLTLVHSIHPAEDETREP